MEEKELLQNTEEVFVLQVCEILKSNNITYIRKDDGIGSYLNVTMGSNSGLKRIFVRREDYEKALKLIEVFEKDSKNDEVPEKLKENVDEDIMENEINKYKNIKRTLFVWIPLMMMLIVVIAAIMAV